jgi:RNA polymerase sigma factor (sigma-70 family)
MKDLNRDLREAGELVGAEGLAPPGQARIVRSQGQGAPEVTDGPFAESKEFLVGYWIVDVENAERAYAICHRGQGVDGAGSRWKAPRHQDRGASGDGRAARLAVGPALNAMNTTGEHLLRELAPQVLGAVVRRYGDFGAAEDAVQEALAAAAFQWPRTGMPDNPRAWLIQVAGRKLADHVRSESARRRRETTSALETPPEESVVPPPDEAPVEDDALVLLFMCCHPALTRPSAIALTLRAVGGLTTAEIASAFLVPEATMAQRISRAKQSIKSSGIGFAMPPPEERTASLGAVLHVLYLIFNEGYAASAGPLHQRVDLATEAIRLARAAHERVPQDGEVSGLLALLLLTDARRAARTGPDGEIVPLDEQDRSLWDREAIAEGVRLVTEAFARGAVGSYLLQAAIAALHDEAARAEDTDWPQITALYAVLMRMSDNPMVALNHAVAVAMVRGAAEALALLARLDRDPRIRDHYRLDAVRAHLLERSGNVAAALVHYQAAAEKTASIPERSYLLLKIGRLRASSELR